MPEEKNEIGMSEERNKNEDVGELKKELNKLIDHRIKHNNGFVNLLRGDYSLFISLIALFLSVYGAWKLGFLAQHYVLSVYLVFGSWLLYIIIGNIRAPKEREDVIKLMSTYQERIKAVIRWYINRGRAMYYSLWILLLLSIPVLWIIEEKRLWMWAPAILFAIFLPLIAEKGSQFFTTLLDEFGSIEEKRKKELSTSIVIVSTIMRILILAIIVIYLLFIILRVPYSFFGVILTMFLILISLASLSEYLSMKFMVTEVSNQNNNLSKLRMEIDRIENTETLKKHKKELLKGYLPKADSFLVFFNYYYLEPTRYTFEVGEEEEGEESS